MRAWTLFIGQPSSCPTFGVYGLNIPQDPTIKLTPDCVTVHYEEIGPSRHLSYLPSFFALIAENECTAMITLLFISIVW